MPIFGGAVLDVVQCTINGNVYIAAGGHVNVARMFGLGVTLRHTKNGPDDHSYLLALDENGSVTVTEGEKYRVAPTLKRPRIADTAPTDRRADDDE